MGRQDMAQNLFAADVGVDRVPFERNQALARLTDVAPPGAGHIEEPRLLVIRRSCIREKMRRNLYLTWGKIDARPQLFDQLLQSSSTQTDSQSGRKDHKDKSLLDLRVAALLSS